MEHGSPERDREAQQAHKMRGLQGPVLVLGGSGFIGASLFRALLKVRDDERPHFIPRSIIREGELREAADELETQRL